MSRALSSSLAVCWSGAQSARDNDGLTCRAGLRIVFDVSAKAAECAAIATLQ